METDGEIYGNLQTAPPPTISFQEYTNSHHKVHEFIKALDLQFANIF